jgi:putative spermidine/putrescine transport system substrate-binding protein
MKVGRCRKARIPVAMAIAAALLAACSSGAAAGNSTVHLTMFVWAGANQNVVPEQVVAEYEKTHPNVKISLVVSDNTVTYPKMVAAKQTTPDDNYVDFGFFNASTFAQGEIDKMWSPLDPKAISNWNQVLPAYRPSNDEGIGYTDTTMGLLYNKSCVKSPPTSWSALWSSQFTNKVVWFQYQWEPLLLAAELNGGSASNAAPGFAIWSKHAKNFEALVTQNQQLENALTSGQACIAPWFYSIGEQWIQAGAPLGFTIPKEGAVSYPSYLAMVTDLTPAQKQVVYQIVNLLISPRNDGDYAKITEEVPLETPAGAYLTPQERTNPNLQVSVAAKSINFNWVEVAKNNAAWTSEWNAQVQSNL